jgi:hypothetical protein
MIASFAAKGDRPMTMLTTPDRATTKPKRGKVVPDAERLGPDDVVTANSLATHLGCTRQNIARLVAEAIIEQRADGCFDQTASRLRYIKHLRSEHRRSPRTQADADHVKVKTEMLQLRLMEKRNELVHRDAVDAMVASGATLTWWCCRSGANSARRAARWAMPTASRRWTSHERPDHRHRARRPAGHAGRGRGGARDDAEAAQDHRYADAAASIGRIAATMDQIGDDMLEKLASVNETNKGLLSSLMAARLCAIGFELPLFGCAAEFFAVFDALIEKACPAGGCNDGLIGQGRVKITIGKES